MGGGYCLGVRPQAGQLWVWQRDGAADGQGHAPGLHDSQKPVGHDAVYLSGENRQAEVLWSHPTPGSLSRLEFPLL